MTTKIHVDARSLEALRDALVADAAWAAQNETESRIDWTSLPTLGGEEPANTDRVWSWDATRLLVGTCADNLEIVRREDWRSAV